MSILKLEAGSSVSAFTLDNRCVVSAISRGKVSSGGNGYAITSIIKNTTIYNWAS